MATDTRRSLTKLWRYLRKLKKDFPLRAPVRVRTKPDLTTDEGHGIFGCAVFHRGVFTIHINRNDDESVMIDTLWHEWTHCLLWPQCSRRHSKRFWQVYGEIYQRYLDT